MCKWTKLAINKVMLWDFLRWCPTISATGSERYTSEFRKAKKPKYCWDVVWKSARDMAEGLWCFVWLMFLLRTMGWSTSAQTWNLLWGAVSLATSCEQVINKQEQMLQSNSWEKRSGVLRYPWCFFPFCTFVPCHFYCTFETPPFSLGVQASLVQDRFIPFWVWVWASCRSLPGKMVELWLHVMVLSFIPFFSSTSPWREIWMPGEISAAQYGHVLKFVLRLKNPFLSQRKFPDM